MSGRTLVRAKDPLEIRRLRRELGLKKTELGVSHPVVTRAQRGEPLWESTAERIAKALGKRFEDLFEDVPAAAGAEGGRPDRAGVSQTSATDKAAAS